MPDLKRLLTMPPREIAFRIGERARTAMERAGRHTPPLAPEHFRQFLAGAPAGRFYAGVRDVGLVQGSFQQWEVRAVREADALCRHDIRLLELGSIHVGREIDWHRDPLTGKTWERSFWTNFNPEQDPGGRDSKIIHELNRQQHLVILAKAFALTGDQRYAAEAVSQLLSWIDQNPTGQGINWQSSLEISIRSLSWLWTLFLLLTSQALDDASAQRIGDSLFAQLDHVHRHTSLYSSPNTHLIGEAAVLFIAGLLFRDAAPCQEWLSTGAELLEREVARQFHTEGVHAELSTWYHCYALDFYLQALLLADQNRYAFSPGIRRTVEAALDHLLHITRPDGSIPLLGDDDGGRSLTLAGRNYQSFTDALSTGAILFQRGDFKHQCREFAEETFWLLGYQAFYKYQELDAVPPNKTQHLCPGAGYVIDRSGWGPSDSHMVFDCGGLGMLTGGHSHADALAVSLFANGRELLVDPGTHVYNADPAWRNYFRSTRAHNTVRIDGLDQAKMSGTFRWSGHLQTKITELGEAEVGYPNVVHRRRIVQVQPGYWFLLDDFRGSGQHFFEPNFHFGPDVRGAVLTHMGPDLVTWSEATGLLLALSASVPVETSLVRGKVAPIRGWASQGYGHKRPISSLRVQFETVPPASAMTLVAPFARRPVVRRLDLDEGTAIAFLVACGDRRDIAVFCPNEGPVSVAGFHLRGRFFWARMERSVITASVAIRASEFLFHGRNLLEEHVCAQSAAS